MRDRAPRQSMWTHIRVWNDAKTTFRSYGLDVRGCLAAPVERQPRRDFLNTAKPKKPAETKEDRKGISLKKNVFVVLETESENASGQDSAKDAQNQPMAASH